MLLGAYGREWTDCRSNIERMRENRADDFLDNPLSFVTVADGSDSGCSGDSLKQGLAFSLGRSLLNVAVPWFRAEDYDRIRQISGDNMLPTFAEWEAKMTRTLAQSAAAGVRGEKVIIRPDELLAFAKQIHAKTIDNHVRNQFATVKLLGEERTNAGVRLNRPSKA